MCPETQHESFARPNLRKPPHDRDNLSDDFRILVKAVLCGAMEVPTVGMNHEPAVLNRATAGQISPVSHQNDVQRLLPPRFRPKMKWCFPAAVDHSKQPLCQIGVKRIVVASDPEEII